MASPGERARHAIEAAQAGRAAQRTQRSARVLATLADLQARVRLELKKQPSDFELARLTGLLRAIDDHTARWEREARGELTTALEDAAHLAGDLVDAPFRATGSELPELLLPSSLVDELMAEHIEPLERLGPFANDSIRAVVETGLLGGRTPGEVIAEVGEHLDDPGPFRVIAVRSEAITRTEMGRLHSRVGQRRLEEATEAVPDLEKEWWWSGKTRTSHQAAHGQRRPVAQPFDVGGEQLMYPRDPAGSAGNTILCACDHAPWHPSW